jgi:2'-5' RNA ligase
LVIARESREFKPHLTLARIEELRGIEKLRDAIRRSALADFGTVHTNEMHLYRSELGRGGAKYTRVKTFAFAKQQ